MNHEEKVANELLRMKDHLDKNYQFIGEGRNRRVYLSQSGKFVIKLPTNESGISDNSLEAIRFKRQGKNNEAFNLARCKMVGPYLLLMERVEDIPTSEKPEWADFVDCGQVGKDSKGKVVVYDYGD